MCTEEKREEKEESKGLKPGGDEAGTSGAGEETVGRCKGLSAFNVT